MSNRYQNNNEELRITLLKKVINEGIDSGRATDFKLKKHLALLKAHKVNKS